MTRKLCDILEPIFVEDLVRGINCQYQKGILNKQVADRQESRIEEIAKLCNIIPENKVFGTYKKEANISK